MATDSKAGLAVPIDPEASVVEPYSDALMAQFAPVLEAIPWDVDDGGESMLMRMLEAKDWEDLNINAKLPAFRDLAPCELKVMSISKRQSDLGGKVPVYLMVDCVNTSTGEAFRAQTSAGQPFLAMAMLHHMGNLPAMIEVTFADKVTRSGFRPLNIKVLAADGPPPTRRAVS